MSDYGKPSLDDQQVEALAKFASSPMVRPLYGWIIAGLACMASGVLGWVGSKLDTKADVADLTAEVRKLTGAVTVATSRVGDVQKSLDDLTRTTSDNRGDIPTLKDQMIGVGEQVVIARVTALATDTKSVQERKLRAAAPLLRSYKNQVNKYGATPAGALDSLFANVAIPEE